MFGPCQKKRHRADQRTCYPSRILRKLTVSHSLRDSPRGHENESGNNVSSIWDTESSGCNGIAHNSLIANGSSAIRAVVRAQLLLCRFAELCKHDWLLGNIDISDFWFIAPQILSKSTTLTTPVASTLGSWKKQWKVLARTQQMMNCLHY